MLKQCSSVVINCAVEAKATCDRSHLPNHHHYHHYNCHPSADLTYLLTTTTSACCCYCHTSVIFFPVCKPSIFQVCLVSVFYSEHFLLNLTSVDFLFLLCLLTLLQCDYFFLKTFVLIVHLFLSFYFFSFLFLNQLNTQLAATISLILN